MHFSKRNYGYWGTSKNYQIVNRVKWGKIDLKGEQNNNFRLFSWAMPHNCCCWLYALIIDKENLLLYELEQSSPFIIFWVSLHYRPMITVITKNDQKLYCMKVKDFRREIREFGEGENRTFWRGDPIPVPSLMGRPEERAKHWQH